MTRKEIRDLCKQVEDLSNKMYEYRDKARKIMCDFLDKQNTEINAIDCDIFYDGDWLWIYSIDGEKQMISGERREGDELELEYHHIDFEALQDLFDLLAKRHNNGI